LTTDNGDSPTILNRNAFAGTLWDDKAGATNPPGAVTDASYVDNVAETPLAPEEGLAAFNGENPNGLWTLTINDDLFDLAVGTLNSWSLEITTIACCSIPDVTTDPVDQSVCQGSTATFTAAASGSPTPTVQWQVSTDGGATFNNIGGETNTTLSFTATAPQNGNKFRAVFTSTCGTDTSAAGTLTVLAAPVVTTDPVNQSVCAGSTATFTAGASGSPAPTVQWQVSTDGGTTFNNIGGATSTTLSFTATAPQNGNKYRAAFTNTCGSATSTAATLTLSTASAITANPADQTVCAGSTATFTAAATGSPTPTVQWQVSTDGGGTFSNIGGATSTLLSFTASGAQNGHRFRAMFSNGCGNATSTAAILTVNLAPVITLQPASQTLIGPGSVTFTAAASGSPAPTVQWQVSTDGGATFNNVPGATSPTLTFTPVPGQHLNRYRAVFTNVCGTATTSVNGSLGLLIVYDISIEQFIESGMRILSFNSVTGHYTYRYCRKNYVFQGQGKVVITMTPNSCKIELNDLGPDPKRPDRNISAIVNPCTRAGNASIQIPAAQMSHTIIDPNTADNTNKCP
ncbi:MAG TPA: proprotein convertase P-domain-containing protein, partial [Blastocatellia bacterium]|nr:proprotein convertase P-domain-containing protein [Blastocatellia bacterium]